MSYYSFLKRVKAMVRIQCRILFCLLMLFIANGASAGQTVYRFSIVPQQSAIRTAQTWGPLLKYLEQQTGYPFKLVTYKNIPAFEKGLAKGADDFSYMNPYHYVVFHEQQNYQAMLRARDRMIKGIIVVRKDNPISDISKLDREQLAFPAPAAFAASILPRGSLKQAGIQVHPVYVGSHDLVYLNVARHRFIAGGGILRTLNNLPPGVRSQLRVLWSSKAYTPHPIAYHPRVPEKVVASVRKVLNDLENNSVGRDFIAAMNIKGFIDSSDSDWDDVRALQLKSLLNNTVSERQ